MRRSARSRLEFPSPCENRDDDSRGKPTTARSPTACSPLGQSNGRSPCAPSSASALASLRQLLEEQQLEDQRRRMEEDPFFQMEAEDVHYDRSSPSSHRPPPVQTSSGASPIQLREQPPSPCALSHATEGAQTDGPGSEDESVGEESSSGASSASARPVEASNTTLETLPAASADAAGASQRASAREAAEGPTLLAEQSIVLEGWVTKFSDHLGAPRRRWLVVCDHRVFAYASAHGYLRGPVQRALPRPREGSVAAIGGSPTMALDLRRCAVLPSDEATNEFVILPLKGRRKRIQAGDSRERALWLLALQQSCSHAPSPHALPPLPPAEQTGAQGTCERLLLRTPVGHVHCVTRTPAVAPGGRDDSAGAPLLCVHGAGASSAEFGALLGQLSTTGRRVVAIDLPGCGASDKPLRARQAASQALADALAGDASALARPGADATALMAVSAAVVSAMAPPGVARASARLASADTAQRARRVCLLGSGFTGGLACLSFAAAHPDKVSALVLADCTAPHGAAELLRALAGAVACGVLVLWSALPLAGVRVAGGRLQLPGLVGDGELAALRTFSYCAEVRLNESREGAAPPPLKDVSAAAVPRVRSGWAEAVLAHLAKYD